MISGGRTNRFTLCAGLGLLTFVLRAPTFVTRLFDPDEAAIGVQAIVVRAGGTLYTDIYDRKPPLPPLLYAASFSITDSTDVRLMRLLVTCCWLFALCWLHWTACDDGDRTTRGGAGC